MNAPSTDLDHLLQNHLDTMNRIKADLNAALSRGDTTAFATIVSENKATFALQAKLVMFQTGDSHASRPVGATMAAVPKETSITIVNRQPTVVRNGSEALTVADYAQALWQAVADTPEPFTLNVLLEYVKRYFCLRQVDLVQTAGKRPLWAARARRAFKDYVQTNRHERELSPAQNTGFFVYLTNSTNNGQPGLYSLTQDGKAELAARTLNKKVYTDMIVDGISGR